jgi:hypothetical protein
MREFPYDISAAVTSRRGEAADKRVTVPIISQGIYATAMRRWGKDVGAAGASAGLAAPYVVETPDIRLNPDGYATCYMLVIYFDTDSDTGRTWKAQVSTDRGTTWVSATKTVSVSAKNQVWRQRIEKTGIWFRFRLQNNADSDLPIAIRSLEVRYANRQPLI